MISANNWKVGSVLPVTVKQTGKSPLQKIPDVNTFQYYRSGGNPDVVASGAPDFFSHSAEYVNVSRYVQYEPEKFVFTQKHSTHSENKWFSAPHQKEKSVN